MTQLSIRTKVLMLSFLLVPLIINCSSANKEQKLEITELPKIIFINPADTGVISKAENNDVKSFKRSLEVIGFKVTEVSVSKLSETKLLDYSLIILPYAAAKDLSEENIKNIAGALTAGVNLLFDGVSKLTQTIEIKTLRNNINVSKIRDLNFSNKPLYWTIPGSVTPFDTTAQKHQVLCIDDEQHLPIVLSGQYGKGKFISMATMFDPNTDKGYSRFPFLTEYLFQVFGIKRPIERLAMEMYFDPGNREHGFDIDSLANQWKKNKIKRIYAAGWYYDTDYDYTSLIKACHENGILVYCWLETPMISTKFWEDHPEWREKTAYLKDAKIDWRSLMNLADENCRKQVFKEWEAFFMKHDWDGIDFAEMYFEPSPVGPALPENFTPMNTIVREEFKKQAGFDPIDLFDTKGSHYWKQNNKDWKTFANYRKNLCFRIKSHVLDYLTTVQNRKKDFELVLTVIDVSLTPEVSDNIGEDTQNTLALCKKYDITLQEEDPSSCWGLTPERYDKLGRLYRKSIKGRNKLVFDCNVVIAHEKGEGGFPSELPSGEELRQIAYNMDLHDVRPCFYSEDAINVRDFQNISTVLANKAIITEDQSNQWSIQTPYTVVLNTGNRGYAIQLDGKKWLAGDSANVIVPEGNHQIKFLLPANGQDKFRISNISGELLSAKFWDNELEFSYNEDSNACYVTVNKQPSQILIDNQVATREVFHNDEQEFIIKLPKGKHVVKIMGK
jgi:hypothetical protein